jgi:3-oxoadipate enol-lactonase
LASFGHIGNRCATNSLAEGGGRVPRRLVSTTADDWPTGTAPQPELALVKTHGWAQHAGVRLAWEAFGEGEPVLFIHGLGYDRHGWGPAPETLAERFRVITFDNRGVGESDTPPGPYSTSEMAADAAAVLSDVGVERAHVVGTSLGGLIAQELALRTPQRVLTLVLSSTTPGGTSAFPMPQRGAERFAAFAEDPSPENLFGLIENSLSAATVASSPELVEEIYAYRLAHPPRLDAWLAQAAAGAEFSSLAALATLDRPTLVTHGVDDNVVDYRNGELIAQAVPGAELVLVPDAGHLCFWERPDAFVGAIASFLGNRGGH